MLNVGMNFIIKELKIVTNLVTILGKHLSDILPSEKDLQRIIDTYYSEDNQ